MNEEQPKYADTFDWVEFSNKIIKLAKLSLHKKLKIINTNDWFSDIGLDSLDSMVLVIYMFEIFGVPAEIQKVVTPHSLSEVIDCIDKHGTNYFITADDALASVKIV